MQSGKARSSCSNLTPLLAVQRQRDGRMENKVADGAIGMRPSAILRRPSIFKSSSLAKRAGGRRVFLSRRKITHCPLSVLRPSPTSCLPTAAVASLVRFSWSTTASRNLSLSPFSGSPVRPRRSRPVSSFASPRYHWRIDEDTSSRKIFFKKKEEMRYKNAIIHLWACEIISLKIYFLTLIYKDVRIRAKYIKNKNFLLDVPQIAHK